MCIRDRLEGMHQDLDEGDRLVRGMGSWWGAITNWFTTDNSHKNPPKREQRESIAKKYDHYPQRFESDKNFKRETSSIESDRVARSMLKDEKVKEWWDSTDKDLNAMGDSLDVLKNMAMDLGQEADRQIKDVEEINESVQRGKERTKDGVMKMWKIG
eukprot:TRINITY_DN3562_c0_g1_i1.p1 TRINITY_DN3562_c0_g1~~TRINITY_DN3562_c0_g1_i1.p1  ORF type:complete len:157 (-),score=22.98 TRINITY_DN3562_c0_g1_i1:333-803(-)